MIFGILSEENHRNWLNLQSPRIDWDAAECLTYSTEYYQRITLESWFSNLEQTPLNRSQQLPAPYKRLTAHRPECCDTSGTFTPFLARTFESSLAKVHKITKKVGQNRSAPLGSFNFTGKRLSLLVSVHIAFVEGMLIKQMRLFLGV